MITQVFINLAVASVPRTLAFWKALGFTHNPQFTGDTAACIGISEHIQLMALAPAKFSEFAPKAICDTTKSIEVLNTLTCDSREQVDELVRQAVAAGGSTVEEAKDYGFMYHHGFVDPDGHCWGLIHLRATPPA